MASSFDIYAAIDLRDGRVVRLEQGDFERETVFSEEPVTVAREFVDGGARWLHIVDLDGARAGRRVQADLIDTIVAGVAGQAGVEVAGGLRNQADVSDALGRGANRIVLGTAALADPRFVGELVAAHGSNRVAVALDVRDGLARGEGWRDGARGRRPATLLARLADIGVGTFEVTAIDRDGLLGGPDLRLLESLVALGRGDIVASGGIRTALDLQQVRDVGCAGAIVGRALYHGSLTVPAALLAVGERIG